MPVEPGTKPIESGGNAIASELSDVLRTYRRLATLFSLGIRKDTLGYPLKIRQIVESERKLDREAEASYWLVQGNELVNGTIAGVPRCPEQCLGLRPAWKVRGQLTSIATAHVVEPARPHQHSRGVCVLAQCEVLPLRTGDVRAGELL
jgi:hypothetical protein